MDSSKAVTATFSQEVYSLTVSTVGSGTVEVKPPGPYHYNDVVTLTAEPEAGWAAKLSPNHAGVYQVWAEALAAAGAKERAIQTIEKGLANTAPTDPRWAEMEALRGTFK